MKPDIELFEEELVNSRKMEECLRKSEEKYRATFEFTGTAMVLIEENKLISEVNREVEILTGYTREDIEGKKLWVEFVHPDDLERMMTYHRQRRQGLSDVPNRYEFRLIHKNGTIKHIMFSIGMIPGTTQSIGSLIDITEQKIAEKSLTESVERYNLLLETIEDGFFEVNPEGNFKMVNDALCKTVGYTREEMLGQGYSLIVDRENAEKLFVAFNKVYKSGRHEKGFTWEYIRKDGSKGMVEASVSLLRDEDGRIKGFCGTARDITERIKMEEKLKHLSMHDSLTGLYNRAYFEEELIRVDSRRFLPVSIICIDVNGLKVVNDTLGHKAGDKLLVATAGVIRKPFRSTDMVARVGGDEFMVVLPNTGEAAVANIVKRIRETVDQYNCMDPQIPISVAIGWATRNSAQETMNDILKIADDSMYRDKLLAGDNNGLITIRTLLTMAGKVNLHDTDLPDGVKALINSLKRKP